MIHGMYCRKTIRPASVSVLLCLVLSASAKDHPRLGSQSTPALQVFVYGFPRLSPLLVKAAEAEAGRILRPASIRLDWVNCISNATASQCSAHRLPAELTIRILPKALPQASATALGIAAPSSDNAAAFLFYDRIVALRTDTRVLFSVLGRVLAHEVTHLLLPGEGHSDQGLMRAEWSTDDLTLTSTACVGLSPSSVRFMYREALRRANQALGN